MIAVLAMFTAVASAADYYVATTGSDTTGDGSSGNPWATIQHAISDSSVVAGDTINVADGTYTITSAIDVNKGVTITGNTGFPENVVVTYAAAQDPNDGFKIDAANITIQGIKVKNCACGFDFDGAKGNTGCTITHCAVETAANDGIGRIEEPSTTISYNTITDCGDRGIYVRNCESASEATRTEIVGNTLSDCGNTYGAACIQTFGSKYVYIHDNTISNTTDKGINIIRSSATDTANRIQVTGNTISLCKYPGIQSIGAPHTYVYDNTLTQCNYYGADGTCDWDYASIHVQDDGAVSGVNVTIDSNTVSDGINGIQTWSDDVTITNNEIYDMGSTYADTKSIDNSTYYNSGIIVGSNWLTNNNKPTGTTITGNDIYNNYYGLYVRDYATLSPDNGSVLSVTAENNWWGHKSGPYNATNNPTGAGDQVSKTVDFTPWYLVPSEDVGTETTVLSDGYGQSSETFAGTDTTVNASGTEGGTAANVTVQTYNYSVPPDAGGALCVNASGQRALKYIDVSITSGYTSGNICITITYTAAELAAAGISDESSLSMYYWDTSASAWVEASDIFRGTLAITGCIPYDEFSGTPICLGGTEEVTGVYEVGGAPTVTVTFTPTEMDPQVEQTVTVNVDVGSGRTLGELTEVLFKTWHDANASNPTQDEFNTATANTQTCAIIAWTPGSFVISPLAGTTWSLGSCTAPTLTSSSGDFTLKFTPGKVATEADGTTDNWQLAATATSSYGTGFGYDTTPGAAMNWYGSIALGTTVNVDWGSVPAGMAFNNTLAKESLGTTVTYICNGGFDKKAKSSATWGGISNTATLDPVGTCDSEQEFALKAYNTSEGSAVLLGNSSVRVVSGSLTDEGGDSDDTNYLWLKLASSFATDTYSGTITYVIAND